MCTLQKGITQVPSLLFVNYNLSLTVQEMFTFWGEKTKHKHGNPEHYVIGR